MTSPKPSRYGSISEDKSPVFLDWPDVSPIKVNDDSNYRNGDSGTEIYDEIKPASSARTDVGVCSPIASTEKTPHASTRSDSRETSLQESARYDVAVLLQHSWRKAIRVLRANPSLMTPAILCLALRQRPPVYVVDWMLRLNPNAAATAPSSGGGPSPLFVAIQEKCSTVVVETVLKAYPQALVAQPPGSQWDPVSLAKRERGKESDLLRLLQRPVSYWLMEEKKQDKRKTLGAQRRKATVIPEAAASETEQIKKLNTPPRSTQLLGIEKREPSVPPSIVTPETKPQRHIPSLLHRTRPLGTSTPPERPLSQRSLQPSNQPSTWTPAERQELDNVKFLCLSLLKSHRRLLDSQQDVSRNKPAMHLEESERQALLRVMEERQQEQARICLIALDMKEKAIHALARRLEERVRSSSDTPVSEQLRSSYVHLYKRFLGLEQELQTLKQRAILASSSCMDTDSSQAVFDPPREQCPMEVKPTNRNASGDEPSRLEQDSREERSRSCLRPPSWLSRPRHHS